jgi:heme-degrading monooxygenase HmoA
MIDVKAKFVSVIVFRVKPGDLPGLAREMQLVVERKVPLLQGFDSTVLLASEDKTQLLVVSLWESRHAWSGAAWDEEIGRAMADAVETAQSFEVHNYEPITVVRAAT